MREFGKLDDRVEASLYIAPCPAQEGAVEEKVLPPRELMVETSAQLEERRDLAANRHGAFGRAQDPRDNFHERRLARAVAADHAVGLSLPDAQVHVRERQKIFVDDPTPEPLDRELLERRNSLTR